MTILKKIPLTYVFTIVLTLVLTFIVVNTLTPMLHAASCASGGCDCGDCEECSSFGGRIYIGGVSIVIYGCSCEGIACQGAAL